MGSVFAWTFWSVFKSHLLALHSTEEVFVSEDEVNLDFKQRLRGSALLTTGICSGFVYENRRLRALKAALAGTSCGTLLGTLSFLLLLVILLDGMI